LKIFSITNLKVTVMKKIIFLCLNLVTIAGYAQISGTGPLYTDDQLGLGFTSTTGISAQLHIKTNGSLNSRLERYVLSSNQNNTFDTYFTSSPVNFGSSVAPGSTIFQSGNHNSDMLFLHGNTASNVKIGLFLKANGYVGIGNIAANERLDVSGNIRINDNKILFRGANDVYHGLGFEALSYTGLNGPVLFGWNGGLLASNNNGTAVPALRWDNSGNVTIGSSTPATGSRLTVTGSSTGTDNMINVLDNTGTANFRVKANGYVYARDLTVQVGAFPDYVFDSTYALMPLHKLDHYIAANHHLPGVPAATTLQENGMSVGQMNVLLMEKVEELTLYVIDLQKQIDEMKGQ
jgi:hypothetical protein